MRRSLLKADIVQGATGMTDVTLRTWAVGHLVVLRGALDDAVRSLSKIERTPAVKACLADKLLTLAASGEIDPVRLGKAALIEVQGSCATCKGCEGISPLSNADGEDRFRASQVEVGPTQRRQC